MNASQSIEVLEDVSVPGGGYALIRVSGVPTEPSDLSFYIRRIGYVASEITKGNETL